MVSPLPTYLRSRWAGTFLVDLMPGQIYSSRAMVGDQHLLLHQKMPQKKVKKLDFHLCSNYSEYMY